MHTIQVLNLHVENRREKRNKENSGKLSNLIILFASDSSEILF